MNQLAPEPRSAREIAAKALNVLAHINRGQAARAVHPIMKIYHEEAAADYAAAAGRLATGHQSLVISEENESAPDINQ